MAAGIPEPRGGTPWRYAAARLLREAAAGPSHSKDPSAGVPDAAPAPGKMQNSDRRKNLLKMLKTGVFGVLGLLRILSMNS